MPTDHFFVFNVLRFALFYMYENILLLVCMRTTPVPGAQRGRLKRALNLLKLLVTHGCEPLCGYWEVNPGPLQESRCSKLLSHL